MSLKFRSKPRKQKSKISQDQVDWLMMELETMREINETLQNNQRSQTKPAGNS